MLKWTCGYYNFFLTEVSVIFIQETAAFNQVLTYQDWHNQLLKTINFILLLNFKESFFNYLKLGKKVADFSERSSRRFFVCRWYLSKALLTIKKVNKIKACFTRDLPSCLIFLQFVSLVKLYTHTFALMALDI